MSEINTPVISAPRLLDQVRDCIRVKHYRIRTERTYLDWIKRYILFHDKRHPKDMGASEVTAFLMPSCFCIVRGWGRFALAERGGTGVDV